MDERYFSTRFKRVVFFITVALTKFALMGDFIIYPVTDSLSEVYGGNTLLLNYILSGPQLLLMLVSFVMPGLVLKFSKKKLLVAGTAAFAAGGVLSLSIENAWWLAAMRTIMGIGQGILGIVSVTLVVDVFVDDAQKTRYVGIFNACSNLGAMILSFLSGILAEGSWKNPFMLYWFAVPMVVMAVMFIPEIGNTRGAETDAGNEKKGNVDLRLTREVWHIILIYSVFTLLRTVLLYYMSVYVSENALGGSTLTASATSLSQVFAFAGAMLFTVIYRKLKTKTMPVSCAVMAAAYLIWTLVTTGATVFAVYCLVCGSSGVFTAYAYARPMELLKGNDVDTSVSVLSALSGIATFGATYTVTAVMAFTGAESFTGILPVLAAAAVILAAASVMRPRARRGQSKPIQR